MTDEELVLLARQGDTGAFDELVIRHQASVDGLRASSRSVAGFAGPLETNLHVDATPTPERNGKIQARIVVFYRPDPSRPDPSSPGGEGNRQNAASVNLDFPIILDNGKTIVASQTTDPGRDRRVTVEVTATILK